MMSGFVKVAQRATVLVVLASVLAGCSIIGGGSSAHNPRPTKAAPQPTEAELRAQVVRYTNQTIAIAGGGTSVWKWEPPVDNPNAEVWDPASSKFNAGPCGDGLGNNEPLQLESVLYGPPVADPVAKAQEFLTRWKSLGYRTRIIGSTNLADPKLYTEIAADIPDGASIGYSASTGISGITVDTACSMDPQVKRDY
ncbi:MAG: hypothetical protein ABI067_18020 [Leifsonia sp.]